MFKIFPQILICAQTLPSLRVARRELSDSPLSASWARVPCRARHCSSRGKLQLIWQRAYFAIRTAKEILHTPDRLTGTETTCGLHADNHGWGLWGIVRSQRRADHSYADGRTRECPGIGGGVVSGNSWRSARPNRWWRRMPISADEFFAWKVYVSTYRGNCMRGTTYQVQLV